MTDGFDASSAIDLRDVVSGLESLQQFRERLQVPSDVLITVDRPLWVFRTVSISRGGVVLALVAFRRDHEPAAVTLAAPGQTVTYVYSDSTPAHITRIEFSEFDTPAGRIPASVLAAAGTTFTLAFNTHRSSVSGQRLPQFPTLRLVARLWGDAAQAAVDCHSAAAAGRMWAVALAVVVLCILVAACPVSV